MKRSARTLLALGVFAVVAVVLYVKVLYRSSAPNSSLHHLVSAPAANPQPVTSVASETVASVTAPIARKKAETAAGSPPRASGGLVAFKDPVTGQLRQPDASEIGDLVGTAAAPTQLRRSSIAQAQVAEPSTFSGPGGSIGLKLGDDSLAFMVVTKSPDGHLAEECVTGKRAAAARLAAGKTPKSKAGQQKTEAPQTPQTKEIPDEM